MRHTTALAELCWLDFEDLELKKVAAIQWEPTSENVKKNYFVNYEKIGRKSVLSLYESKKTFHKVRFLESYIAEIEYL